MMFSDSEDEEEVIQPGKIFIRERNDSPVSKLELTVYLCLLLFTVKRNRTFFQDSEDEEEMLPQGKLTMTRILCQCKEKRQRTSKLFSLRSCLLTFRIGRGYTLSTYVKISAKTLNFHITSFCSSEGQGGERHSENNKE